MIEKELQEKVRKELDRMYYRREILWHTCLTSGRIGGVTFCKAGTPDNIVILPGPVVLFLELKTKETKFNDLRYEQRMFFKDLQCKQGVYCRIIWSVDQLKEIIKEVK